MMQRAGRPLTCGRRWAASGVKPLIMRAACAALLAMFAYQTAASGDAAGRESAHVASGVLPAQAQAAERPASLRKVCPEILFHRSIKDAVRHLPDPDQREAFAHHRIDPVDLDTERVALYVTRELAAGEIDALRGHGVRLLPHLYIPPVEGRHPHGFYAGSIDYNAIPLLEDDDRFVRVTSLDVAVEPTNDLGLEFINAHLLHKGPAENVAPLFGAGVAVAIADSGFDLSHPDIPAPVETFDVTTGSSVSEWSTNVQNTVIWHGTHVAGTVVGTGEASDGAFMGAAPAADLHLYKIGNNSNGNASWFNIIQAVERAVEAGCRVFNLSYGGFALHMDGSSSICQAFDNAFAQGLISFASAGNNGARRRHHSVVLEPGETSDSFDLLVGNNSTTQPFTSAIVLQITWRAETILGEEGAHLNLVSELGEDDEYIYALHSISPRDTESKRYVLIPMVEPDTVNTYQFQVSTEPAAGVGDVRFHVYQLSTNAAIFPDDDPHYTTVEPALGDTVVAVGAWRHRHEWIDYFGNGWFFASGGDILAPFSSRGPRIDGVLKPEIVAPGSMTISLRDSIFANASSQIISNFGANDGTGPAEYYIAQGTSMAAPLAAGAMALLLEHEPQLTPEQAVERFTSTASDADDPNPSTGHGMVNVFAALMLDDETPVPGDLTGDGNVGVPDLLLLLGAWGQCSDCDACPADLDGNCTVDEDDLLVLLENWG